MSYHFSEVIMIGLFVFGFWYWNSAQRVKEIAYRAVRRYCNDKDLQLLDDYVALNAFWLKRNEQGRLQIWRSYLFEFTATGEDRFNGRIILLGQKIESIQLEPYRY